MDYNIKQNLNNLIIWLFFGVQTSKINHMIKTREKKKNVLQVAVFW